MQIETLRSQNVREKKIRRQGKILSRDNSVASRSLLFPPVMFPDPEFPVAHVAPMSIARTTF
jgi:hypothetical protein